MLFDFMAYAVTMTSIKTDKHCLPTNVQINIVDGWILDIDIHCIPIKYTLTHGKKSLGFSSSVTRDLCSRNYSIKLTKGRKQMIVPPHVLQAFVDYDIFIGWYNPNVQLPQNTHDFELEIAEQWWLKIDGDTLPITYTLTHGKKFMSFHGEVMKDLCTRNYGYRLAKGRRQMVLPPHVLQGFVDNEKLIRHYDNGVG